MSSGSSRAFSARRTTSSRCPLENCESSPAAAPSPSWMFARPRSTRPGICPARSTFPYPSWPSTCTSSLRIARSWPIAGVRTACFHSTRSKCFARKAARRGASPTATRSGKAPDCRSIVVFLNPLTKYVTPSPRPSPGGRGRKAALGGRPRRDVPALAAGAVRVLRIELLVDARHRVLAVVGDVADRPVELGAAFLAVPEKPVLLFRPALALEDEQERVGREARRVPHARRAVDDLALADPRHLLLALGGEVVQVHVALDHVHDLVARVRMELAPVLASAGDEGDGVGRLPQNADRLDALPDALGNFREADGLQFGHALSPSRSGCTTPLGRCRRGRL